MTLSHFYSEFYNIGAQTASRHAVLAQNKIHKSISAIITSDKCIFSFHIISYYDHIFSSMVRGNLCSFCSLLLHLHYDWVYLPTEHKTTSWEITAIRLLAVWSFDIYFWWTGLYEPCLISSQSIAGVSQCYWKLPEKQGGLHQFEPFWPWTW